MNEWISGQEWSEEFWVAAWIAIVVLVSLVYWGYGNYLKR